MHKNQLIALKNGNKAAFVAVYGEFYRPLYGYAMTLVKSKEFAEEIVQEVFIKLWLNRKTIDPCPQKVKSYLFAITKNQTFNILKKMVNNQKLCEQLRHSQRQSICDTDKRLLESEMMEIREKALLKLPPKRRRIFIMSKIEGKSYQEISIELNISIQTVKNQMSHSLKTLKAFLEVEGIYFLILLEFTL